DEDVPLSTLIQHINERFGTEFNAADQLFFDQIVEAAANDERLQQAARVNPEDKFKLVFEQMLETLFAERIDQNEEIFSKFMNDAAFKNAVAMWLGREVYSKLSNADKAPPR